MNRTENKVYFSDCAILRAVRLRGGAVRSAAARWQSWRSTGQRCFSIITLAFSRRVACSPLASIHWWVLTKRTSKNGYLAAHYAVPRRRINEYDLCLIGTCATSLALYCYKMVYGFIRMGPGSINPVRRKWMWRKWRERVLIVCDLKIKFKKSAYCAAFWVTFEFLFSIEMWCT